MKYLNNPVMIYSQWRASLKEHLMLTIILTHHSQADRRKTATGLHYWALTSRTAGTVTTRSALDFGALIMSPEAIYSS